jgi:hypothetical protein
MAITSNTYTGNGTNKLFSITFPYLNTTDIDVYINGTLQTVTTQYTFANATTVEFVTAPANGATVLLDRSTDDTALNATFFPGSSIKASDLNENFDQVLYLAQETNNNVVNAVAGQIPNGSITNVKLAADSVTSSNLVNDTIVNADVNASAGIVATKLSFTQSGTGATARTVDSKLKDVVSVKDFGAVGDGVVDDAAAIQNAANSSAHGTLFFPRGTYLVSSPITVTEKNISGESALSTIIKASAAIASVFQVTGINSVVESLKVDGNLLADSCIVMSGTNSSTIRNCTIERAKLDGIQYGITGNNSNSAVDSCLIRTNGTEYATGTAAGTISGSTVTITGAANLTTLGIRLNESYIYMAGDAGGFAYEITAVTATTVTVYPTLASTFSGSTYKILQGSGINIRRQGDNNRITIKNCNLQGGKVAGIQDLSLYSAISIATLYQSNSYGRICGARQAAQPTYGPMEFANYYEGNTYNDLLYAYALGENVRISASGAAPTQRVFSGSTGPTILSTTAESTIPTLGVAFPAVQTVSSNANTLDDYEEGTWTPVDGSGASLSFTAASGLYVKIGKLVYASGRLTYPTTAGANTAFIGGLPFNQANTATEGGYVTNNTSATPLLIRGYSASELQPVTLAGTAVTNSTLSASSLRFTFIYSVTS